MLLVVGVAFDFVYLYAYIYIYIYIYIQTETVNTGICLITVIKSQLLNHDLLHFNQVSMKIIFNMYVTN